MSGKSWGEHKDHLSFFSPERTRRMNPAIELLSGILAFIIPYASSERTLVRLDCGLSFYRSEDVKELFRGDVNQGETL